MTTSAGRSAPSTSVDELFGVGPGLVLAVVRVELRTVLVEVVPGVHDLESGAVGGGLEGRPAQRQATGLRAVDADDDPGRVWGGVNLFVRHAERGYVPRPASTRVAALHVLADERAQVSGRRR